MRLRVVAGSLGGRFFASPATNATHPMSERMRGALFNSLGNITGQTLLDPFAGTGAISFEALSRGAASAVLIERERRAQAAIAKNIEDLGLGEHATLIKTGARSWSDAHPNEQFDLIICDPPYNDPQFSTIQALVRHLKPKGLMVVSYVGRGSPSTVNGVVVVTTRLYGDSALAFYHKAA